MSGSEFRATGKVDVLSKNALLLRHGNDMELIIIMFDLAGVKSGHVLYTSCE